MATRLLPAETGKADAETLSRVVPLQKPPRRANLPVPQELLSATRPVPGPADSADRCPGRDFPSRPGTVALPGGRNCFAAIPPQRSSEDCGSKTKFTQSGVCTLSRYAKPTFRGESPPHPRRAAPTPVGRFGHNATMRSILDLIVPTHCAGCDQPGTSWCTACAASLRPFPVGRPGLSRAYALAAYAGPARRAVLAYKEKGRHELSTILGTALATALPSVRAGPYALVPAPSRPSAARARYGQHMTAVARACARALTRATAVMCWP